MTKINRDKLLKTISTVQPALSKQDLIPALKHIQFKGGFAAAFDDLLAIQVVTDLDLEACLPGDSLARTLASFNADSVSIDIADNGEVKVGSGRSHVKMASMPVKSFPSFMPLGKPSVSVDLTDDFVAGLKVCLPGAGNNPKSPASLGITMERHPKQDVLVLYATDGNTITRYTCKQDEAELELEKDEPMLLPTRFCEQIVSLYARFNDCDATLKLYNEAATVEFVDDDGLQARVVTKVISGLTLFNYAELIERYINERDELPLFKIPDELDSAIDRAVLVLGSNIDKVTKLTPNDDGFKLYTVGDLGEASDSVEVDGDVNIDDPVHIDPLLIGRACKMSTHMALFTRVVAFTNKQFLHIVSTCSASKKG